MSPTDRPWWPGWASLALVALGIAATIAGLQNQFVQDDLSLIVRNDIVHTLAAPGRFFMEPYWRDPFPPALYRPLATMGLAMQWVVGGGSAVAFRIVSMLMLVCAGLAVFRLGSLVLPRVAAWIAAAIFMVHPVHVEATAPAVNQGELMVGILVALAVTLYVRARMRNTLDRPTGTAILLLYLAAVLFKEHALVLPALLLVAELTVLPGRVPLPARIRAIRPIYLSMALIAVVVLGLRTLIVGDTVGTPTAEALRGVGVGGRLLTMLAVVPRWAELLFWPARLQADYGLQELVTAKGWGIAQAVGAGMVIVTLGALGWSRVRLPAAAFGIAWILVALVPVSNVLIPTGVILAERTLFLASVGAALLAGAVFGEIWTRAERNRRVAWMAIIAVAVVLGLGIARSASRTAVWRSQESLLRQTVADAPRSYTAHLAMTRFLEDSGSAGEAASHYRAAVALMPVVQFRERNRAEQFAAAGYCRAAVRHYRRALIVMPGDSSLQNGLARCLAAEALQATPSPPGHAESSPPPEP